MIDRWAKLGADAGKGGRANGRETIRMARRRYQTGCLLVRGKRRKMWVARWREDVIRPDGTPGRVLRSEVLGPVSEIPTRRAARQLLNTHLQPFNQGRCRPQSTITFAGFVAEHFEPVVLPTFKFSTRQGYASMLRKHLLPRFGDERLCDISRAEIQRFVLEKLRLGYAWEMANRIRDLLSKVLGTAVEWGYLEENPARGVKMPERTLKRPRTSLSADEVRKLLGVLDDPVRTIALLAVLGGLRIGEILALRWGRVDFSASSLRVEESYYHGRFGTPKTQASRRTVALPPIVVQALVARRSRCLDDGPDSLVFGGQETRPFDADHLRDGHLKPACVRAGLKPIDFHTLRHTHSSLLHATGTPLKVAQAQLGHSSMAMTLGVYTHALPDAQRQAVEKLERVLFPSVPNSGTDGECRNEKPQRLQ